MFWSRCACNPIEMCLKIRVRESVFCFIFKLIRLCIAESPIPPSKNSCLEKRPNIFENRPKIFENRSKICRSYFQI